MKGESGGEGEWDEITKKETKIVNRLE